MSSRKSLAPPQKLFTAAQVKALDRLAIESIPLPGFELMKKAGREAFRALLKYWPRVTSVSVLCGGGNNGGDGYVIAKIAKDKGLDVQLLSLVDPASLKGEAHDAFVMAQQAGVAVHLWSESTELRGDVIVDALLGIGLKGAVREHYVQAIQAINATQRPVLAVDIPSGLCSDTGSVLGVAVVATVTIAFIGMKRGLVTGQAPNYCGELVFADLSLPESLSDALVSREYLTDWAQLKPALPARQPAIHKGVCGHVLVIGGNTGMGGAALLAGEAALRSGAGMVTVATHAEHVSAFLARRPELMVKGVRNGADLQPLLEKSTVVVLGPGLGRNAWAQQLKQAALRYTEENNLPMVLDADALNLIAEGPALPPRKNWVLTPHPGEAARLLGCTSTEIEQDRYQSVRYLQAKFGGAIVLKGAGNLVAQTCDDERFAGQETPPVPSEDESQKAEIWVIQGANPGMATAGMGDVLSGLLGALIAQKMDHRILVPLGVALHQEAGRLACQQKGVFSMLATDVIDALGLALAPSALVR